MSSFQCPKCRKGTAEVIDSRVASKFLGIRRRRSCSECLHRFTTYEAEATSGFFSPREHEKRIVQLAQAIMQIAKTKRNDNNVRTRDLYKQASPAARSENSDGR